MGVWSATASTLADPAPPNGISSLRPCEDVFAAEARLVAAQHPAHVGPSAEALAQTRRRLAPLVQRQMDQHRRVDTVRRRLERILAAGQGASVGQLCRALRTLGNCQRDQMAWLRAAAAFARAIGMVRALIQLYRQKGGHATAGAGARVVGRKCS